MEYYSDIKKKMKFTIKWMNGGTIILSDISQTQEDKCFVFPLISRC